MSRRALREPPQAALVVAAMWGGGLAEEEALSAVGEEFGCIIRSSPVYVFTHTAYYDAEMGAGLRKIFVELEAPRARDGLVAFKRLAMIAEDRFLARDGGRRLNVDPMLVSLENVVVASSKSFAHRVYLGDGVFGDVQLMRRKGGFETLPWTFKDYAERLEFFDAVHASLPRIRH